MTRYVIHSHPFCPKLSRAAYALLLCPHLVSRLRAEHSRGEKYIDNEGYTHSYIAGLVLPSTREAYRPTSPIRFVYLPYLPAEAFGQLTKRRCCYGLPSSCGRVLFGPRHCRFDFSIYLRGVIEAKALPLGPIFPRYTSGSTMEAFGISHVYS